MMKPRPLWLLVPVVLLFVSVHVVWAVRQFRLNREVDRRAPIEKQIVAAVRSYEQKNGQLPESLELVRTSIESTIANEVFANWRYSTSRGGFTVSTHIKREAVPWMAFGAHMMYTSENDTWTVFDCD